MLFVCSQTCIGKEAAELVRFIFIGLDFTIEVWNLSKEVGLALGLATVSATH
jgi:hypothetical protein